MTACVLYLYALASGFVTPECYINKETMIEPEAIHELAHAPKEFMSTVKVAPKAYIEYWRNKKYASGTLNWDPNYYLDVKGNKIDIIHMPWKTPKVRKLRKHYKRYKHLLYIHGGDSGVANWEATRIANNNKTSD